MKNKIIRFFTMNRTERKYKFRRKFFPHSITSKLYGDYLRNKGIEIGKGTFFFDPCNTGVDVQRPWMLRIGSYCKITSGVSILTHDYSRSVIRRAYNEIIGEAGTTVISDNVFIGINTIILMGSYIGENTIIGAGSVVRGSFPPNVVIAGNPAKVIMTLDEYYKKLKDKNENSGLLYLKEYYKKYNKIPKASEMGPFFPLFLEKTTKALKDNEIWTAWNGDDEAEIIQAFLSNSLKKYSCYEEFIKRALSQ